MSHCLTMSVAVVNYTSHEVPYTRVIEHKHFEMFGQEVYDCPKTVISEEYSTEYKDGMEPYYPVNNARNNEIYQKYKAEADALSIPLQGGQKGDHHLRWTFGRIQILRHGSDCGESITTVNINIVCLIKR